MTVDAKPVARGCRIPERQTHSAPSRDADMAGDVKKGFIHGERGGEHRRQRHDGRRHGCRFGRCRNDPAAPAGEHGTHMKRRAPCGRRAADLDHRRPGCRFPDAGAEAHDRVGERDERKRDGQRCVGQRRHAHAAQEDAPRERDGGQEGRLVMAVSRGLLTDT